MNVNPRSPFVLTVTVPLPKEKGAGVVVVVDPPPKFAADPPKFEMLFVAVDGPPTANERDPKMPPVPVPVGKVEPGEKVPFQNCVPTHARPVFVSQVRPVVAL